MAVPDMNVMVQNFLIVVDLKYWWRDGQKLKKNKKACFKTALLTL
jgi:hypothetical protein